MSWVSFDSFELNILRRDAEYASHPGPCDQEVSEVASSPKVSRQLDKIGADKIRRELSEYGAWDEAELADDAENRLRIVWIACGDIAERARERRRA